MSLPMHAPAASIAATRKGWALDYFHQAAWEYHERKRALEQFTAKAAEYGCTEAEIAEALEFQRDQAAHR